MPNIVGKAVLRIFGTMIVLSTPEYSYDRSSSWLTSSRCANSKL